MNTTDWLLLFAWGFVALIIYAKLTEIVVNEIKSLWHRHVVNKSRHEDMLAINAWLEDNNANKLDNHSR